MQPFISWIFASFLLAAAQEPPNSPAGAADPKSTQKILYVIEPHSSTAWMQATETIAAEIGKRGEVASLDGARLEEQLAAKKSGHRSLNVFRMAVSAGAQEAWWIDFHDVTGVLLLRVQDLENGLLVTRGVKVRSAGAAKLEENHLKKILDLVQAASTQLQEKRLDLLARAQHSYQERCPWREEEDPPHPGFLYRHDPAGTSVTHVYPESTAGAGKLQAGDLIQTMNDQEIPSPAHFGKALGPRKAGDRLELTISRAGELHKVSALMHSSSELIPRYQCGILNQSLAKVVGEEIANRLGCREDRPRILLLFVAQEQLPDSFEALPVLEWLRARHPEAELQIIGVARAASESTVGDMEQVLVPGFRFESDPQEALCHLLRVTEVPAFVLVDRAGQIRFRPVTDVEIHHALQTLLKE